MKSPGEQHETARGAAVTPLGRLLGSGTFLVAVATAGLYVAGSLYLDAYYGRFGIPEGTLT